MTAAPRNTIIVGDAATELHRLPAGCADMVLTSPPYYRLRNYDVDGQIGLEPHIEQWVDELDVVARGLRRVLTPTGTLWLNLGDSYSTHLSQGAPRKSLLLGPERLAQRLLDSGWILRNKIVWTKSNPMPSSVRDRLNTTHEYLYVFTQQPRYYFDLDAIRVPLTSAATERTQRHRQPAYRRPPKRESWRGPNGDDASGLALMKATGRTGHRLGKNPGDSWRIASSSFRGAHHATFPVELADRAIRAGCPPGGVVLDPFMGAGTTAVAAEQLGRDWLGVELNPDFAELAQTRIAHARHAPSTRRRQPA